MNGTRNDIDNTGPKYSTLTSTVVNKASSNVIDVKPHIVNNGIASAVIETDFCL